MPTTEERNGKEWATFHLRDYLQPNGVYEYRTLAPTMEEYLRLGFRVVLISVPGHVAIIGTPDVENPWGTNHERYKTAGDALSLRNGISIPGE